MTKKSDMKKQGAEGSAQGAGKIKMKNEKQQNGV